MAERERPKWYRELKRRHPDYLAAVEQLGQAVRAEGPLDEKTSQLIQLAGAAAVRSEGSVHSHVRRALEAGAKPEEVCQSLILLTSIIGYPAVAAALSWANDIIEQG